jgi:hypothetical protein
VLTRTIKERAIQASEVVQRLWSDEATEQRLQRMQDTLRSLGVRFKWGTAVSSPVAERTIQTPEQAAEKLAQRVASKELEELSRAELYALACELDIRGRKNLRKEDLIQRIREAQPTAA